MKKFEGKINDKTFTDEQEFYKAAIEAMKNKNYNISSTYKVVPENGTDKVDVKTTVGTPTENNEKPNTEKTDKIKIEAFDSEKLLANSYEELDSYIRSAEDRFDDWLLAFDESYESVDVEDIIKQERIQSLNTEAFIKDYKTQWAKVNDIYAKKNNERENIFKQLQDAKAVIETYISGFANWARRVDDADPEGFSEIITAKEKVKELSNKLVECDKECKRCSVELNYLSKIKGYINIYKNYLKGIRDIIDIYSTKHDLDKETELLDHDRPVSFNYDEYIIKWLRWYV